MNQPHQQTRDEQALDPKIRTDWEEVEARRLEISSRNGGDTRRQAILARLAFTDAPS